MYTHFRPWLHIHVHVYNSKMVFTFSSSTMVTISLLTYLLNTVHVTRQAFYNTQPQHTHTHDKIKSESQNWKQIQNCKCRYITFISPISVSSLHAEA